MKARFIIPLIVCLLMTAGSAGVVWGSANPEWSYTFLSADSPYRQLYKLDQTAAALYTAANANNRQAAYAELQKLNKLLAKEMLQAYGTSNGWAALKKDAAAIEQALSNGYHYQLWIEEAVRVRLGADSLIGGAGALWLQYEGLLQDDLLSVRKAWKRQTDDSAIAARAMLNELKQHARRIEIAALYAGDSVRMSELLARISYTDRLLDESISLGSNANRKEQIEKSLDGIETAVIGVFMPYEDTFALPAVSVPAAAHPLKWSLFLGTIISAVLTWTGWRKYKQNPYGIKKL